MAVDKSRLGVDSQCAVQRESMFSRRSPSLSQWERGEVRALPVPLGQQTQAQRVQLDESCRILLVIGARIVLERHVAF